MHASPLLSGIKHLQTVVVTTNRTLYRLPPFGSWHSEVTISRLVLRLRPHATSKHKVAGESLNECIVIFMGTVRMHAGLPNDILECYIKFSNGDRS